MLFNLRFTSVPACSASGPQTGHPAISYGLISCYRSSPQTCPKPSQKNICYNNKCELFLAPHAKYYEAYKAYEEASQCREGFRIVLCAN